MKTPNETAVAGFDFIVSTINDIADYEDFESIIVSIFIIDIEKQSSIFLIHPDITSTHSKSSNLMSSRVDDIINSEKRKSERLKFRVLPSWPIFAQPLYRFLV